MGDCPFCKIASHEAPAVIVYEDEEFVAFMDKRPVSDGHLLVAPKAHYEMLMEMEPELVGKLFTLVARLCRAVWRALRPDGINVLQNNGPAAWQYVSHVHVHIIPRWAGDGIAVQWPARPKRLSELERTAARIRDALVNL